MASTPPWLADLVDEIEQAAGDADRLGAVFERLRREVGAAEAGRRWWAAFGATDASAT